MVLKKNDKVEKRSWEHDALRDEIRKRRLIERKRERARRRKRRIKERGKAYLEEWDVEKGRKRVKRRRRRRGFRMKNGEGEKERRERRCYGRKGAEESGRE